MQMINQEQQTIQVNRQVHTHMWSGSYRTHLARKPKWPSSHWHRGHSLCPQPAIVLGSSDVSRRCRAGADQSNGIIKMFGKVQTRRHSNHRRKGRSPHRKGSISTPSTSLATCNAPLSLGSNEPCLRNSLVLESFPTKCAIINCSGMGKQLHGQTAFHSNRSAKR